MLLYLHLTKQLDFIRLTRLHAAGLWPNHSGLDQSESGKGGANSGYANTTMVAG